MEISSIRETVERMAEQIVLADVSDLPALAAIHAGLETLMQWAMQNRLDEVMSAAQATATLVEKTILAETPDPNGALRVVGNAIGIFQKMVHDGRPPSHDVWPMELGLHKGAAPPTPPESLCTSGSDTQHVETAAAKGGSQMLEGDPELLQDFVTEAMEHLENADMNLLILETEPSNEEALHAVFRAFHTIKGVAGFLALREIQALAHEAENLLDKARKHEVPLVEFAMDLTFDAVDMLKKMIVFVKEAMANGGPLQSAPGFDVLVQDLKQVIAGQADVHQHPAVLPVSTPQQKVGEILTANLNISSEALEEALRTQRKQVAQKKFGEVAIECGLATPGHVELALDAQREEVSPEKIGEILVEMGALAKPDVDAVLRAQQDAATGPKLGEILVKSGVANPKDVAQAIRSQRMHQQASIVAREPVKVDANRLDLLVDTIGELVIAESMVFQSAVVLGHKSGDLARYLGQLDKITRDLQEMGMSLRMVPIRTTFQKMARLVRDLSKKAGKHVEFVMSGEDTELDKTVVDKIGDPLVHMVRNAVDHGLEATSEDRVRCGKPPIGTVCLRAFHKGGNIYIEIEDDGRGLDTEAILAKALERGLVREGNQLTDREIQNLIFLPGFSTARKVTDVSGRGVGMDVVRKNIEALRGEVEIYSEPGKGTRFSIRLPLTLAIIDGMVVRVGEERYIIPTLSIVTSLRLAEHQLVSVVGQGEMLKIQGKLLPLFRLERTFGIRNAIQDATAGIVVVVEADGRQTGLLVDDIIGQQQTVIKSLGDALQGISGIAGGAILPNGSVGLILDIAGLLKIARDRS